MPKSSDAWRKLKAAHRKGPKRVRLQRPRKKSGIPALANPQNVKKIQIIQDGGVDKHYMVLVVFKQVFASMRLGPFYTMPRDKLTGKAALFKRVLDEFGHNDYILGRLKEMKLDNKIGKCLIVTGKLKEPDATFYITRPVVGGPKAVQTPRTVRPERSPERFEVM
jgi:hypothetical protein